MKNYDVNCLQEQKIRKGLYIGFPFSPDVSVNEIPRLCQKQLKSAEDAVLPVQNTMGYIMQYCFDFKPFNNSFLTAVRTEF